MHIKLNTFAVGHYDYRVYAANHRCMLTADGLWYNKSACIRAAKKMAEKLNIEYREN